MSMDLGTAIDMINGKRLASKDEIEEANFLLLDTFGYIFSSCMEYNDYGVELDFKVKIPYEKLKTFILPRNCGTCPVGYMNRNECGRRIPLDYDIRPDSCRLEKIDIRDIIDDIGDNRFCIMRKGK